ncbi:hypothetical protein F4678DRAFT_316316 [Xylaria arbuscula]|nr:hypothetical protein F4678DRAFT_316316 [Xylaria arbuscula]
MILRITWKILSPHKRKKPKKPRDPNQPPKPLAKIRGRKGLGAFDYKNLLSTATIEVSLMDLLQLSPDFSRNLKHLSIRTSEKVKRTMRRYAKMKQNSTYMDTASATLLQPAKAYRMTPTIRYSKSGVSCEHTLPPNTCQGDQGSDVNIIHHILADDLGLKRLKIRDLGFDRLFLLNSAGKTNPVIEFVVFVATVASISRPVWAIVQPSGGRISTLLILGLPWLWDVMATFDIRKSTMTIGDPAVKEDPVQIRGPALSFGEKHKLVLVPSHPKVAIPEREADSSGSEDSTDFGSFTSGLESEN